ncbi:MAG: DUF1735 domain-containing protein [Ferruginibacter sp.]
MKMIKYTKTLAVVALVAGLITSCEKVKSPAPLNNAGQTVVKLVDGGQPGIRQYAIDFVPTPTTLTMADLRRDVSSNSELNRTMNVTIIDDTAALRAYNVASGAGLIYLPAAFYTIKPATPKTGGMGGRFNIVMNPGEFAKPIDIVIPNATVLDPSSKYGLAFTITSADADGVIAFNRTVIVEIGAKNNYDGEYNLRGFHNRPGFQYIYDQTMHMVTTGANSVIFYWPLAGSIGHPIQTPTGPSWYGPAIAPHVVFDPSTNLVTNVFNNAGGTVIDIFAGTNSGQGRFIPSTKEMFVYWRYLMNNDRAFMDTLTYIGPR